MPGRPPDPNKKFVYLDWSTFGEAFDGFALSATGPQRGLNRTVHAFASGTNLCLSLTHVWELVHLEDASKRLALAKWLDQLDVVWIHSDNEVIKSEVIHAVLDAVHGRRTAPPVPTVPSSFSFFEGWDQEGLNYALKHPSLADFVEEIAGAPTLVESLGRYRQLSVDSARRFWDDRVQGLKQVTKEQMIAFLDQKLRANLEVDVRRAAEVLRRDPRSGFHTEHNGMFVAPTDEQVLAALNGFPDLTLLPWIFLSQRVMRNMSFEVIRRPSRHSGKFEQQRGDLYDQAHLVGAAYCDVFTCDKRVARWLAGGRELLGFSAPISGPPEVVNERLVEALQGMPRV